MIGENTAKYAGGSYQKARWIDIIHPPKEETRTPEEIIADIRRKLASG